MTLAWIFVAVIAACTLVYSVVIAGFRRGLQRLGQNVQHLPRSWPSVSVVVPARNEAEVLSRTLDSLLLQDYEGEWEIIVVDDRSSDSTPFILANFAQRSSRVRPVRVTEPNPPSPKKNAIALGIHNARGDIIVTTDADCTYNSGWLRSLTSHMTPEVGVVAGLTVFDLPLPHIPVWQKVQWLDFFVQNFLAAGAIGAGVPGSCNGSNLAYRRQVYEEIGGFGEAARIVSGDDVLFAQRVAKQTRWKIVFATTPESVVKSLSVDNFGAMLHQRIRWASKGLTYRRSMLAFLFGVYLYYLLLVASPIFAVFVPSTRLALAGIWLWRTVWDYRTVQLAARIFRQDDLLQYFPLYFPLHIVFTPFFGLAGLITPFRWKGQWYRTAKLPRGVKRNLVRVRRLTRLRRALHHPV